MVGLIENKDLQLTLLQISLKNLGSGRAGAENLAAESPNLMGLPLLKSENQGQANRALQNYFGFCVTQGNIKVASPQISSDKDLPATTNPLVAAGLFGANWKLQTQLKPEIDA